MIRQEKERIQYLFLRYMDGEASAGERLELSGFLIHFKDNSDWEELLEEIYHSDVADPEYDAAEWQLVLEQLMKQNREYDAAVKPFGSRTLEKFRRIAIAASVLFMLGFGSYLLFFNKHKQSEIVKTDLQIEIKAPDSNRAVIILSNGEKVFLDNTDKGTIAEQGNIKLVKKGNGQIAYQSDGNQIIKEMQ